VIGPLFADAIARATSVVVETGLASCNGVRVSRDCAAIWPVAFVC
jgi:hypothetical protein